MHKMALAVGFTAGYVLGARAGRQRYEQIAQMARKVRDHPTVQSAAGVVGAQASELAGRARDRTLSALHLGHPRDEAYVGEPTSQVARSSANGAVT